VKIARSLMLALALLIAPMLTFAKEAPDFTDTLSKATLAVYSGKQVCGYKTVDTFLGPLDIWGCKFESHFTCTATVVEREDMSSYAGLTAGHCFNYELMDKGVKYYVSENLSGAPVLNEIKLLKFETSDRYDYALFSFHSLRDYPVIEILRSGEQVPPIGTPVLNANFSLGVVKQVLEGKIVSTQITGQEGNDACDGCKGRFFVSIGVGPGASGSAIVDAKSHKIIGMTEAIFPSTQMATLVVPMGDQFIDFMNDDSAGIRPEKPTGPTVKIHEEKKPEPESVFYKFLKMFFFPWS
jgi:hypothetical protein